MYFKRVCMVSLCVMVACSGASTQSESKGPVPDETTTALDFEQKIEAKLLGPLRMPVVFETQTEALQIKTAPSQPWRAVPDAGRVEVVFAIKTTQQGAVVRFGDPEGMAKLWIHSDSEVFFAQDDKQVMHLHLQQGLVRFSRFDEKQTVMIDSRIPEDDVLLLRESVDGPLTITTTAEHLGQADWSLALEMGAHPQGIGSLTARTSEGDEYKLELQSLRVDATRFGDYVENRVEQIYNNDTDNRMEGTFRFFLPPKASVTSLAMEIDGKLMVGELVEREKAQKTYEAIVDSMRDPALLEWQQGQTFKLRVFPIEPRQSKRIVLSFISPLLPSKKGFDYRYPTAGADMQTTIDEVVATLDGKEIMNETSFEVGREIQSTLVVPHPKFGATMYTEMHGDTMYAAIRVRPKKFQKSSLKKENRALVLWVDTSRSALEQQKLTDEAIWTIVNELPNGRTVATIACDVACRVLSPLKKDRKSADDIISFIDLEYADGASNLSEGLTALEKLLKTPSLGGAEVLYIGDGIATWGETSAAALVEKAKAVLSTARLSAMLLGKGADDTLFPALTGIHGGRLVRPKTPFEVKRFAVYIKGSNSVTRLRNARLEIKNAAAVFPNEELTLFGGETMTALCEFQKDMPLPKEVVLTGTYDNRPFKQRIPITSTRPTKHVAHRYAAAHISDLHRKDADKAIVVKTSLDFGVMSKYTSFLVLESEDAYKRWGIERRSQQATQNAPVVSGRNLEALDDREASLHPNNIQPGDPEIRIPAPSSAKAVTVVFPFGESKRAVYEPALEAWTVRFLIDKDTPEGEYQVIVRITHEDDTVEMRVLHYTVDTHAPQVELTITKDAEKADVYHLFVKQIVTEVEMQTLERQYDDSMQDAAGVAQFVPDLSRVEITLETGRIVQMRRNPEDGTFYRTIRSKHLDETSTLHIATFDRALNSGLFELPVVIEAEAE